MIALLQRVTSAHVAIDGEIVGRIDSGVLAFVCAEKGDSSAQGERLLERVLGYRMFSDEAGKMNRSLRDVMGGLLLVPQFTLAADTSSGTRPSLGTALEPGAASELFAELVEQARRVHANVECGRFGANMQVGLVNDGPVTFWLTARAR
jgi:D-tyrosyl-tRNA(Tyr) deacylase